MPKENDGVPVACPNTLDPGAEEVAVVDGAEAPALDAGAPKLKLGVDIVRRWQVCDGLQELIVTLQSEKVTGG